MASAGPPRRKVRRRAAPLLLVVLASCGGAGQERACGLVEELPPRTAEVTVGQLEELTDAARRSEDPEIRAIGEQVASTVQRAPALDRFVPDASGDILEADLDRLRRACERLEATPLPG